jgi:cob(I)alamin adenosyltransferase
MSLAQGTVQVFVAPQRSLYADVLANALRTAGQGAPVLVVQLFEGGSKVGVSQPTRLCQHLLWLRCQTGRDLSSAEVVLTETESDSVRELWAVVKEGITAGAYRLVVVEGLNLAIARGLVSADEALQTLTQRPPSVDVVLTGQEMPSYLLEIADQITKSK